MQRKTLLRLALLAAGIASGSAHAGTICNFSGNGNSLSNPDCMNQPWTWTWANSQQGWGIPGIGNGTTPYLGTKPASDFHWRCTSNCGPIGQVILKLGNSPFSTWTAPVSGNQVDFFTTLPGDFLVPGQSFFVNIDMPWLSGSASGIPTFDAWWTDDFVAQVPEPASLALTGAALLAAALARRRRPSALG